ncbi:virulence plasmid A protein [Actinacidiphila yanglinensis]|uniref:Virulence plasmid A protein n=1 Tax=Actinacidiphila yanglinensis TaxID=310779 RepID=A0A1H6DLC7_9ACTN|nr:neuraminidase-like domain-containing protein [Actinacidiphila yanglinensis]SEG85643.1 virulence plasmid A protein [Actinacidiphila yanglinensis]
MPEPLALRGRIYFQDGVHADGLALRLFRRGFAGVLTEAADVTTDGVGDYAFPLDALAPGGLYEVHAVPDDGAATVRLADSLDGRTREPVNLVAPRDLRPLVPEYDRLVAALTERADLAVTELAKARERGGRQDLGVLHQATGWDSRLLALVAKAERVAAEPNQQAAQVSTEGSTKQATQVRTGGSAGLSAKTLYAMFRAGLPTEPALLARRPPAEATEALKRARDAGIVAFDDGELEASAAAFASFAGSVRMTSRVPGTVSTPAELLDLVDLPGVERAGFERALLDRDGGSLWDAAAANGVSEQAIRKLRTQGKLAALTLNNAPLVASLQAALGDTDDLGTLVSEHDLHIAENWTERLADVGVPEAARPQLAQEAARRLRIAYPTEVATRLLESGAVPLRHGERDVAAPVAAFLRSAADKGFMLGVTPVHAFLRDNPEVSGQLPDDDRTTLDGLRKLVRLHQITPSDAALAAVTEAGFTSARDIAALPQEEFLACHADAFPSELEARLVYSKAQQVHAVTLNFITGVRQLDATPATLATAPRGEFAADALDTAKQGISEAVPTLEKLFGSVDFCACVECRSVLSPAAYLVDLLDFLDIDTDNWAATLARYKSTHPGVPYPGGTDTPYDVLTQRRPDLPNLALSCENTHIALPYIDIVNEVLEFWIAGGGRLGPDDVRNTTTETTEELLAEPRFVIEAAYGDLADAVYPRPLPFDLWTETVRAHLEAAGVSFWRLLDTLRVPDDAPADGTGYGAFEVAVEHLGLSPAETGLYTNTDPVKRTAWYMLYGHLDDASARKGLATAKSLARRLGVDYEDFVDLIRTGFVNPRLPAVELLRRIGLDVADIVTLAAHEVLLTCDLATVTADERDVALAVRATAAALDKASAATGVDLRAKVRAWAVDDTLTGILLLWSAGSASDFDAVTLRYADRADRPVAAADLMRLNLFVRLRTSLKWSTAETDRALCAFFPQPTGEATPARSAAAWRLALTCLSHVETLRERADGTVDRERLVTLWTDVPTTGVAPLYARLFLTRDVLGQDEVFDHPLGAFLTVSGETVGGHLPALQSALGLSAAEMHAVLADAGLAEATPLTIRAVSVLHRYAVLAEALAMPVRDLIALKAVSGASPFTAFTGKDDKPLLATLRFQNDAALLDGSGCDVADMRYLVLHDVDPDGPHATAPTDPASAETIGAAFAKTVPQLRAENAAPAYPAAYTDDRIAAQLALLLPPSAVEAFFRLWNAAPHAPERDAFRADHLVPAAAQNPEALFLADADLPVVFPDTGPGGAAPVPRLDPAARERLAATLAPAVQRSAVTAFAIGAIATAFGIEPATAAALLTEPALISAPDAPGTRLLDAYLDTEAPDRLPRAHTRLCKIVFLATALGLSVDELRYASAHPEDFGGFDADTLPLALVDPTAPEAAAAPRQAYSGILALIRYTRLRTDVAAGPGRLPELFAAAERATGPLDDGARDALAAELVEDFCALLARLTGTEPDSVAALAAHLDLTTPASSVDADVQTTLIPALRRPADLARLVDAVRITACVGAPIRALLGTAPSGAAAPASRAWAAPGPDANAARGLRDAARSRVGPETWPRAAAPISDRLRRLRRDALVARVGHLGEFPHTEALFEHFLLDPGTEPVVQTSRLRLAISSVQTFVQRCLLGLEERVDPSVIDGDVWAWMKRYRVWEANRKVFLWPENYLWPEFRDDKTHLFRQLEGGLLQSDLGDDAVEDAFVAYLHGLQDIARLDIVAMAEEKRPPSAGTSVLHVVGRTYSAPHRYFVRRYANHMWTPWEPIPLDIQAGDDHLAAIVWRGRLNLFWVTFTLEGDPSTASLPVGSGDPPLAQARMSQLASGAQRNRYLRMNLHWSEYVRGTWTKVASSGFAADNRISGSDGVDPAKIQIVPFANGEEVDIVLTGAVAFWGLRVGSRQAPPRLVELEYPISSPYDTVSNRRYGTRCVADREPLTARFPEQIDVEEGDTTTSTTTTVPRVVLAAPPRAYSLRTMPQGYWGGGGETELPFFYSDDMNTFHVEPTATEVSVREWRRWAIWDPVHPEEEEPPLHPHPRMLPPIRPFLRDLLPPPKEEQQPDPGPRPDWREGIDPRATVAAQHGQDWLVNPVTVLSYDDRIVGERGGIEVMMPPSVGIDSEGSGSPGSGRLQARPETAGKVMADGASRVVGGDGRKAPVGAGRPVASGFLAGARVRFHPTDTDTFAGAGLRVVGGAGFLAFDGAVGDPGDGPDPAVAVRSLRAMRLEERNQ